MSAITLKCSRRRFKIQNDLRDWELDSKNKPVKVVNEKFWNLQGVSIDPKDIPVQKITVNPQESLTDKLKRDIPKRLA